EPTGNATALNGATPGVLTGEAARGDWTTDAPGVRRHLKPSDLEAPYATRSAFNFPRVAPRPEGAWPKVPEGFEVQEWVTGLNNPRVVTTAPNGDIFVAESTANRIRVVRPGEGKDAKPD